MDIQQFIDKHLRKKSMISWLLLPLGLLYGRIQHIRRFLYQAGWKKSYHSRLQIISIGNIVSGGAGKTPFTIYLGKLLQSMGKKIVVSHRGYKGDYEDNPSFISDEEQVFELALKAGDEPQLLAKQLPGIPIIVGKDRRQVIKLIEVQYPDTDFVLLDDSFQHLQVKHNFDFVVFNSGFGIANGFILPAGLLRESLTSLRYVSAIIWNDLDKNNIPSELLNCGKDIIKFSYQPLGLFDEKNYQVMVDEVNKGNNALLSGIGYPKGFERSAQDYGLKFSRHFILPDHYDYQDKAFLVKITKAISENRINSLIVTEKDFVKLQQLVSLPVAIYILKVELTTNEDDYFLKLLLN